MISLRLITAFQGLFLSLSLDSHDKVTWQFWPLIQQVFINIYRCFRLATAEPSTFNLNAV